VVVVKRRLLGREIKTEERGKQGSVKQGIREKEMSERVLG